MSEETTSNQTQVNEAKKEVKEAPIFEPGVTSEWLTKNGFSHKNLPPDHLGIEIIEVDPNYLYPIAEALKKDGFNYLQCQGGYDEGAGQRLVSFYHLIEIKDPLLNELNGSKSAFREVRIKVFLNREGELKIPSLYSLFNGADWQERETFDMFGINFENHPHPKRLLMPEDWKGWPLRKDYVQPDFYEMQDAY